MKGIKTVVPREQEQKVKAKQVAEKENRAIVSPEEVMQELSCDIIM